jgi:DNA-binding winged helix-turn-helix (wHTH) protein
VAVHRFGEFVLDGDTRELLRDGRQLRLSPKAFQLLEILVARSPTALSKLELQDALWPDTFVIEANLQHLIGELRAALSDDRKSGRFIRTIHGFGYAFKMDGRDPKPRSRPAVFCRLQTPDGMVTLGEGEYLVGRDPAVQVVIDSTTVSRRHAAIRVTASEVTIEDLGSRNGSFVCGRRVVGVMPLSDGDTLRFGRIATTLRIYSRCGTTRSSSAG